MEFVLILFSSIILLGFYMLIEGFGNRVKEEVLAFKEFPKQFGEFTIFFISDIHRRTISNSILEKVHGKADIVIIGGDLTERGVPMSRVEKNLMKLRKIAPVYFVWGNNDYEVDVEKLLSLFEKYKITELKNKVEIFQRNEKRLALIGIDDLSHSKTSSKLFLKELNLDEFNVLISHNPKIIHALSGESNIPLVLSGHTHGGQIRIFGYGPYKKGGIRRVNGFTSFVSNGYGTTGVPLRLGAKAETHLITMKHGNDLNV